MKKVFYIIMILLVFSFALLPYSLDRSSAKYKDASSDYTIQVVDRAPRVYDYTGAEQIYEIPVSGFYYISAWGGNGGLGGRGQQTSLTQSNGGISQDISGVYYLEKGETIYIYVGGAGESAPEGNGTGSGFAGGINGLNAGNNSGNGGNGGAGGKNYGQSNYSGAGGGGGAASILLKQSHNISSIVLASGGGAGAGGGFGSITGSLSYGGYGGDGATKPTADATPLNGADGSTASNRGGAGATSNSTYGNGLDGEDGGVSSLGRIGAGGGAGGGGRRIQLWWSWWRWRFCRNRSSF